MDLAATAGEGSGWLLEPMHSYGEYNRPVPDQG
jgi:hypothetical protein